MSAVVQDITLMLHKPTEVANISILCQYDNIFNLAGSVAKTCCNLTLRGKPNESHKTGKLNTS